MKQEIFENIQSCLEPDSEMVDRLISQVKKLSQSEVFGDSIDNGENKSVQNNNLSGELFGVKRRVGLVFSFAAVILTAAVIVVTLSFGRTDKNSVLTAESEGFGQTSSSAADSIASAALPTEDEKTDSEQTACSDTDSIETQDSCYYLRISKIPGENDKIPITDQAKIDEIEAWVERAMSDSETVYLKEGDFPQYGGGGANFYTIQTTESVKDRIYFVDKADIDPSSYLDNNSQPYKYINNFTISANSYNSHNTYMQISKDMIAQLDDILADVIDGE